MAETMVRQTAEEVTEFGKDIGLVHEVIVTGRKVGAGKEFWSKLAHDEELFAKTVAFVERDGTETVQEVLTSIPLTEAEKSAIAVLGPGKILTQGQAKGKQEFPIRYFENTLRACAKENAEKGTDWRFVYLRGNSLTEERERVGANRKRQPCFYDNGWWLGEKEASWATGKFESGYYLIDFNGRFGRTSWQNQEKEIEKLGPDFERTHEAAVTEAALRIFEATGERLLLNWYHWGRSLDSLGVRVYVGFFDSEGWYVYLYPPDWDGFAYLRVCLSRKFQN